MGTRSLIAWEQGSGVRTACCFMDGYPEGVGRILLDHYRSPDEIGELMELRHLGSLGASPRGSINEDEMTRWNLRLWREGKDDEPLRRFRAERCITASGYSPSGFDHDSGSIPELLEKLARSDAQYLYIWGEGGWTVSERPFERRPEPLETVLAGMPAARH